MSAVQQEAMQIEAEAWKVVQAFDTAAEDQDRRVAYAALILIMNSFCRSSASSTKDILEDFCSRINHAKHLDVRQ